MIEIKAPNSDENIDHYLPRIFLAGSIEMGMAENWQTRVARDMADYEVVLLNPRRDDWDSSWKQSIDDPQFNQQVTWELNGIDDSEIVIFYFDPNTKSPITLMELGIVSNKQWGNVLVCCPDGFWRKGNVEMVCDRYEFPLVNTYEEMMELLIARVKEYQ
jgi:hypothetical protein